MNLVKVAVRLITVLHCLACTWALRWNLLRSLYENRASTRVSGSFVHAWAFLARAIRRNTQIFSLHYSILLEHAMLLDGPNNKLFQRYCASFKILEHLWHGSQDGIYNKANYKTNGRSKINAIMGEKSEIKYDIKHMHELPITTPKWLFQWSWYALKPLLFQKPSQCVWLYGCLGLFFGHDKLKTFTIRSQYDMVRAWGKWYFALWFKWLPMYTVLFHLF